MICILRGGVLFLADLMRCVTVPNTIDFMAVSSTASAPVKRQARCGSPWILKKISSTGMCFWWRISSTRLYHRLRPGVPGNPPSQEPAGVHLAG